MTTMGRMPMKHMTSIIKIFAPEREEVRTLLAMATLAGLLLALLHFASEVMEGETHAFDNAILLLLRDPLTLQPLAPAWLTLAVQDITALGGTAVLTLLTLLGTGFLVIQRKYADAALVLAAITGGTLLSMLMKGFFGRERPDVALHLVDVSSLSFPSGHAMLSAVTYLTLGALLARSQERLRLRGYIMFCAIVLTLLVGMSRVYLGVHWPTDVLAGWCFGALWAMACWLAAGRLQRKPD